MRGFVLRWIRKILQVTLTFYLFVFQRSSFTFGLPDPLSFIVAVPTCFIIGSVLAYLVTYPIFGRGGGKPHEGN